MRGLGKCGLLTLTLLADGLEGIRSLNAAVASAGGDRVGVCCALVCVEPSAVARWDFLPPSVTTGRALRHLDRKEFGWCVHELAALGQSFSRI